MKKALLLILAVAIMLIPACSLHKEKLSDNIVGEWTGQIDATEALSDIISDKISFGINLPIDPIICDITFCFNEDGSCYYVIDSEALMEEIGDSVRGIGESMLGISMDGLVDSAVSYFSEKYPIDKVNGVYVVDDENNTVTIHMDDGEEYNVPLNKDGCLVLGEEGLSQSIVFKKN